MTGTLPMGDGPATMQDYDSPHLTHGVERARLLVRQNRLRELTFDDLTAAERQEVLNALAARRNRVHRRAIRAKVVSFGVAAVGLVVAGMAFAVGPASHISPDGHIVTTEPALEAQLWMVALGLLAAAIAVGEHLFRRRRRLARMLESEGAMIDAAIARSRDSLAG